MPEIITQLKELRIQHNLTQEELAHKLQVTRQTINAIEQGKYQPTLYLAYKCAKLFNTTIESIFNFKE
jgi:putative transcriptional regulator